MNDVEGREVEGDGAAERWPRGREPSTRHETRKKTHKTSRLFHTGKVHQVLPALMLLSPPTGERTARGVTLTLGVGGLNCKLSQADTAALQTAACRWIFAVNISEQN